MKSKISFKNFRFDKFSVSIFSFVLMFAFLAFPLAANDNKEENNILNYTYHFEDDEARTVPSAPPAYNLTMGKDNTAQAGVVSYTDANGLTSNVLRAYDRGPRNDTGVINFNVFPKAATDYSVIWKQCNDSPDEDYKTGVLLRGNTRKIGSATVGYTQGLMNGYVFLPYNTKDETQFRIYKSTDNTNLDMLINNAIPQLVFSEAQPVWYRASVEGSEAVSLKIEYSTDSIEWHIGASIIDEVGSFKKGATQFLWGLAAARTDFYIDNVTFSGVAEDNLLIPENPEEPVPGEARTPEYKSMKLRVDNKDRDLVYYAPEDLPKNRPLLFSFHGMNMWHVGQFEDTKYWLVADTAKFVIVCPNGIGGSWDVTGTSDTRFVSAIIDKMHEIYDIDRDRVYVSGFSWGGNFCYRIAKNISHQIAAIAPIMGHSWGGNLPSTGDNPSTCTHPMPILQFSGKYDDLFKAEYVQPVLDKWIDFNGCSRRSRVTNPYPEGTSGAYKMEWINRDTGVEVAWIVSSHGHSVPMDKNGIFSSREVWEFCSRYSLSNLSSSVPEVVESDPMVVSEEFYNLMGQKLSSADKDMNELFIQKVLFSDGTIRSEKMYSK